METWGLKVSNSIKIIEPVSYFEIIYLLENCMLVLTDGGGLQKEAFFFKKTLHHLKK
jgi:UDP-GlcNAc3NAcA epimerase